jgi:hypothetical protein
MNELINSDLNIIEYNKKQIPSESIGFAAFFSNKDTIFNLFEYKITDLNSFNKYPNEIKRCRNVMIYLTGFQIIASILAMLLLLIRRSFIYVFINLISLALSFFGLFGAIKLNAMYLIIHCVFTTSIFGGFFFYQLLDLLFGNDTSYGNNQRYNDNLILFLFSLPYLYDCCVGIYNYLFLKKISQIRAEKMKNNELLKNETEKFKTLYSDEQINKFITEVDKKICVICMNAGRETVLNPCGHILCCEKCAKTIFDKNGIFSKVKCPICNLKCNSYMKVYVS